MPNIAVMTNILDLMDLLSWPKSMNSYSFNLCFLIAFIAKLIRVFPWFQSFPAHVLDNSGCFHQAFQADFGYFFMLSDVAGEVGF